MSVVMYFLESSITCRDIHLFSIKLYYHPFSKENAEKDKSVVSSGGVSTAWLFNGYYKY